MSFNYPTKNRYVGKRYAPLFCGVWDGTKQYESLSIVQYQGSTYTSKLDVPTGVDITNTAFWVCTANYDQQLENYRQEALSAINEVENARGSASDLNARITTDETNVTNLTNEVKANETSLNNTISEVINNNFHGKKYVAMGDSITLGFVNNPYPSQVGSTLGMTAVNMGVSGSLITVDPSKTDSMFERRSQIPTDADVISIMGGTNDYAHGVIDMGIYEHQTHNLGFYGTVFEMIQWLVENRPNAKLFFITPTQRGDQTAPNGFGYVLEDYVNAIIDVCKYWSIPVLDLYHMSDLSPLSTAIATQYYDSNKLHPLQNGHDILSKKIIQFLRGI